MNLNKQQIIKLVNVSPNTWGKINAQKKKQYIDNSGYKLIDTYKVGREVFYEVEPKGEELVKLIQYLQKHNLPVRENSTKFIKFVVALDSDGTIQLSKLAIELKVNYSTIYRWRKALEREGLIIYDEKANPARFINGKREMIEEYEWSNFTKKKSELAGKGLDYANIVRYIRNETGYFYRRVGEAKTNAFSFQEFYSLLDKALDQLN